MFLVVACGGDDGGGDLVCGDDVTVPVDDDGCCTAGANANTDNDCSVVCGNGEVESGEQCDDGNTSSGDGCDDMCASEVTPTAFRIDTMNLADPHLFAVGSLDVTGTVNNKITDSINFDGDMPEDGMIDLSIMPVFWPLDQVGATTRLDIVFADCSTPVASTECTRTEMSQVVPSTATNSASGCTEVLAGTSGGFSPAIVLPAGPCFASDPETFVVDLGGVVLGMIDAVIAADYVGDPSTTVVNGLIRGFVTQDVADAAIIPEDTLLVGGDPLSTILRDQDKDVGPGGETGWWFYLNFTATVVPYTE